MHGRLARLALAAAALTTLTAAGPAPNWNATVTVTPEGTRLLGNPAAEIRLTEYVSYTCPHCARFETEADAPLRIGYIAGGRLAVEISPYVRDPVDLTVALLTHCGPPAKFFLNHAAFMRSQSRWIAPLSSLSPQRKARWTTGSFAARTRAIARDLHFYAIMGTRGYAAPQVDACLADEKLAERLAERTREAAEKLGVQGTPSLAINGVLLAGTHDWETLRPQLEARLR